MVTKIEIFVVNIRIQKFQKSNRGAQNCSQIDFVRDVIYIKCFFLLVYFIGIGDNNRAF